MVQVARNGSTKIAQVDPIFFTKKGRDKVYLSLVPIQLKTVAQQILFMRTLVLRQLYNNTTHLLSQDRCRGDRKNPIFTTVL